MTQKRYTEIPKRQKCVNKEEPYIGGAVDIVDDELGKPQSQVNQETNERVSALENKVGPGGSIDERIAVETQRAQDAEGLLQSEINALDSQNYVTVSDYASLPATGSADTIYRVSSWDGNANSGAGAVDATKYSEYAWNAAGSEYKLLDVKTQIGEVFDISEYHSGQTYADLEAALGTDGANVPEGIRKGGMSVKFVQSSDNKYVQFFCTADEFTIDVARWAICDDGVYVEDSEYIDIKTDSEGNILEGIKKDATKHIPGNLQVDREIIIEGKKLQDLLDKKANEEDVEENLATKLDKIKNGINNEDTLSYFKSDEDFEYLQTIEDSNGKILEGITKEGRKEINIPIEFPSVNFSSIDDKEWMDVTSDSHGNILEGLNKGKKYLAYPSNQDDYIQKQVDSIKKKAESTPQFVTVEEFNAMKREKMSLPPYYLFTNSVLIDHGKVSKNFIERDYYAKIGLFGDPHVDYDITGYVVTDPPVDVRFGLAVEHMNQKNVDFGFSIGDNTTIEYYPERVEYKEIFYNKIKKATYPVFSIVGNHDRFTKDFTENGIIEINNVRVICFGADFVIVPSMGANHNTRGDVTDATMDWLTKAVRESYEKGFITILACHYPLAHTDTHGVTFEESIRRHRDDIISLCQQYDVKLFIGGHEHGPNLEYMIVSNNDITLDMMNVQLGLSYISFSTLVVDETGFHFVDYDTVTGEQLHTLYVPFENQASGTIYE